MAFALPPVEGKDLMAGRGAQLLRPFIEQRRGDDLAYSLEALRKVRSAEDAELLHEDGETASIDDDRNGSPGPRLLEHVLILAELRAGEETDGELAGGAFLDALLELLKAFVQGVLLCQRRVDAERIIGGESAAGDGAECDTECGDAPRASDDAHESLSPGAACLLYRTFLVTD
jgi:hypothetical protein